MAPSSADESGTENGLTPAGAQKSPAKLPLTPQDEIKAVARKISDNPVPNSEPAVWGVLTAISKNARLRVQGMNIMLNADEHCIGRIVPDTRFQIVDAAVSGNHCRIFRDKQGQADGEVAPDFRFPVFLKDSSTNGTYINWKKIRKISPEARLQHGDIISFVAPPHEENSYSFVYREVSKSVSTPENGANLKRKSEDFCHKKKRTKGIGIGAADGPISLDDVRTLQRANMDLRSQIKDHVGTIDKLRAEQSSLSTRHENELREFKESVAKSYANEIDNLKSLLEGKKKELIKMNIASAKLQSLVKDLNERLNASMQSRADAAVIIANQKSRISELEAQLDEERNQRREERDKAALDLQSALQKVREEAREEVNRQAEAHFRQNKEHEETINKLQESEKESRLLVDMLRSKLEDSRESLIVSEKKVRQLESEAQEKHTYSEDEKKRADDMETELKRLREELEGEKVAREEAWAKVSALELAIAAASHELSAEKQRFQGAKERIILRETQLRAFYSTTEEISALFIKQQEQLKAMQKTLEDEENCDTSIGFDLNLCAEEKMNEDLPNAGHTLTDTSVANTGVGRAPGSSDVKKTRPLIVESRSDKSSSTEKHDCQIETQEANSHEGVEDTQEMECSSASKLTKGFGPDIDGVGAILLSLGTARVNDTESPLVNGGAEEQITPFHRCSALAGETMQLDEEVEVQDNMEQSCRSPERGDRCPQSRLEDTENEAVRTTDLMTSELPGSWAINTEPSIHGENFPRSQDSIHGSNNAVPVIAKINLADTQAEESQTAVAVTAKTNLVDTQAEESQTAVAVKAKASLVDTQAEESQTNGIPSVAPRLTNEHVALNNMIGIVAPDRKEQFQIDSVGVGKNESISDAETEDGSNHGGSSSSDSEDDDAGDPETDLIADSVG